MRLTVKSIRRRVLEAVGGALLKARDFEAQVRGASRRGETMAIESTKKHIQCTVSPDSGLDDRLMFTCVCGGRRWFGLPLPPKEPRSTEELAQHLADFEREHAGCSLESQR
jgi:hypothetical protein